MASYRQKKAAKRTVKRVHEDEKPDKDVSSADAGAPSGVLFSGGEDLFLLADDCSENSNTELDRRAESGNIIPQNDFIVPESVDFPHGISPGRMQSPANSLAALAPAAAEMLAAKIAAAASADGSMTAGEERFVKSLFGVLDRAGCSPQAALHRLQRPPVDALNSDQLRELMDKAQSLLAARAKPANADSEPARAPENS